VSGCGCKICKRHLGEYVNELITLENISPKQVLEILQNEGLTVSDKLLRKHLSAFGIQYPETMNDESITCNPITTDLNTIDFTEYDFDSNNPESIIKYLQNINLKIYLNQTKITLQAQQDVINGNSPDIPKQVMQNLALAFQILDKSTGLSTHVNQQEAIKTVEAMGLVVQSQTQFYLPNVSSNTQSEAN
jgi:hypothetical protein